MKALAWIHDLLFGKPRPAPRTAPPACPYCDGRRWILAVSVAVCCDCGEALSVEPRRARCPICIGTGVVPAAAIAGGPHLAKLCAYRQAFPWN